MKHTALLSAGTPLLVAAAAVFAVGDLNPPAGSVAATGKTLLEIEPRIAINATNTPGDADSVFKIAQSGSYYLTGNVSGAAGKHGIEIAASGVTLDLNGFDLIGVVTTSLDGVSSTASGLGNITVRNGSIRSWGDDGVDTSAASNCTVENIRANNNTDVGILAGLETTVSGCSARNNGTGIQASFASTLSDCTAVFNSTNGFRLLGDCRISACTATDNGLNGIAADNACNISLCVLTFNGGNGISVAGDCRVVGNTCDQNGFGASTPDGAGILVSSGDNRIEDNNCTDNDRGLDVNGSGNIILRNTCSGNITNWDVVVGNALAPIVNATTNATAVLGSTYAGSLGSTDPNANFSY